MPSTTALDYLSRSIPYAGLLVEGWRQQGRAPPSALAKHWLYRASMSAQLILYVILPVGATTGIATRPSPPVTLALVLFVVLSAATGRATATCYGLYHAVGTCALPWLSRAAAYGSPSFSFRRIGMGSVRGPQCTCFLLN